jgi:hypothetical protein
VPGDRADQDLALGDRAPGQDDRVLEARAGADRGAVADDHRADEPDVGGDAHVAPDPHRRLDQLDTLETAAVADAQSVVDLVALGDDVQDTGHRVEGARAQLVERSDVVPVLVHLVDVEGHAGGQQRGEDVVGPVDGIGVREVVEDLRLEQVDPAVAEIGQGVGRVGLLLEAGDPAVVVVQHDAVLARVVDLLDRERGDAAGRAMAGQERPDVDVGQCVAGDDEERLGAEEVLALAHAACRARELRLVDVLDRVAEVVADRVREVMQVGDDPIDALATQVIDDVSHHRPVEHRDHRLGDLVGQRAQTRAQSGGENLSRQHRRGSYPVAGPSGRR